MKYQDLRDLLSQLGETTGSGFELQHLSNADNLVIQNRRAQVLNSLKHPLESRMQSGFPGGVTTPYQEPPFTGF